MTMDIKAIPIEEVKTCDLKAKPMVAALCGLNPGKILSYDFSEWPARVTTAEHPSRLVFPKGWYYAKHCIRNKHNSTTGLYDEVDALNSNGSYWEYYDIGVEDQKQCEVQDFNQETLVRTICAMNSAIKFMSPIAVRCDLFKLGNDPILILEGGYIERTKECIHLAYGTQSVDIFF